jgi:hypothetical protein
MRNFKNFIRKNYLLTLFIFSLLNLTYFIFVSYKKYAFNSDSAVKVLLAEEILKQGNYFPPDFYYVNNDIWVIFGHTFIAPLLLFFPPGYLVHALASLISVTLILISVWWLAKEINVGLQKTYIILTVVSSGISLKSAEHLFGQTSYGTILYLMLVFALFFKSITLETDWKSFLYSFLLILITTLMTWANPGRAIVYYFVPLSVAVVFNKKYSSLKNFTKEIFNTKEILLFSLVFIGFLLGYFLHSNTLSKIAMDKGYSALNLISLNESITNLFNFATYVLNIFGGNPAPGRSLFTVSGFYDLLKIILSSVIFINLIKYIKYILINFYKISYSVRFFFTYSLTNLIIVALLQITTSTLKNGNYLIPAIVILFILMICDRLKKWSFPNMTVLNIVIVVLISTNMVAINTNAWYGYNITDGGGGPRDDPHIVGDVQGLIATLEQEHLNYGYATFWYAGLITVLSDGNVIARSVGYGNGKVEPQRWLSAENWYKKNDKFEEKFILTLKNADTFIDFASLNKTDVELKRVIDYQKYRIFVIKGSLPFEPL